MTTFIGNDIFEKLTNYSNDFVGSVIYFKSESNSGKSGRRMIGRVTHITPRVGEGDYAIDFDSFSVGLSDGVYKDIGFHEWGNLDGFSVGRDCKNCTLSVLSTSEAVTLMLTKDYNSVVINEYERRIVSQINL